jgi:outer membrane protein OmpA-like peptidoglycan-associated protein
MNTIMFSRFNYFWGFFTLLALPSDAQEPSTWSKWSMKPGVDALFFDRSRADDTSAALSLAISYRFSDSWTADLSGMAVPYKTDASDDYGLGCAAEVLYHLTRFERIDPYVACGAGYYNGSEQTVGPRTGLGILYHLTEQLAFSVDTRATLSVDDGAMMYQAGIGLSYTFGSEPKASPKQTLLPDGSRDSDGDGLSDDEESMRGTDPFNKDSDNDALSDYEESKIVLTDPLNADTDFDGLLDGEEVHKWKTDPRKRDTDGGGVDDWHELHIDSTNPLSPGDDLILIEIPASFDYNLTPFRVDVIEALERLADLLVKNPQATAQIEAHIDRKMRADEKTARSLTEKNARLAVEHLTAKGVRSNQLSVKGFGFARPKVQANLVRGNPENRRFEIYVKGLPRSN